MPETQENRCHLRDLRITDLLARNLITLWVSSKEIPMPDRTLSRELILIVLIKLVVLTALWWFFIRDARVVVVVPAGGGALSAARCTATLNPRPQPHGGPNGV